MTAAFFCLRFSISRVVDRVCLVATTRRSNLQGPLNSKVLIDLRDSAADARRPSVAARFFTGRRIGRVDVGARRRDRGCIITNSFGRQLTTSRHGDILRHCLVLRKRRGAMSRDLHACIETVARMSHRAAFCIDFPASGAVAAKTVCYR